MRRRMSCPLRGRMDCLSHHEAWRDSSSAADRSFMLPPDTQRHTTVLITGNKGGSEHPYR